MVHSGEEGCGRKGAEGKIELEKLDPKKYFKACILSLVKQNGLETLDYSVYKQILKM